MTLNESKKDRWIRLSIAVAIAIAGIYFESWWGLLAIVPGLTALTGVCPLYGIMGISTCKRVRYK